MEQLQLLFSRSRSTFLQWLKSQFHDTVRRLAACAETERAALRWKKQRLHHSAVILQTKKDFVYGQCAGCYDRIDPQRLKIAPETIYCQYCEHRLEKAQE